MQIFGFDIKFEGRDATPPRSPLDDKWYQPMWYSSQAGVDIDPDTAMMYSAVYGCVKIIAETIACCPLIAYKRQGESGKKRADNHAVYNLLKSRPNYRSTAMSFRETLTAHQLLRGNGYAEIIRNYGGDPISLNILHPTRVEPNIDPDTGYPYYRLDLGGGKHRIIPFWDMFHLQGYTDHGLEGMSVIAYMKESIGLGVAAERFGATFFANNATPSGVLQMGPEMELSEQAKDRLKADWLRKYGGEQKGGIAVLEEGMEWKSVGIPATDAQWLETRKFQVTDIARFFRVPPHMLAELDRSTNNNIEHQSIEFLTFTMLAHFVRWEQTISRDLFNASSDPNSKFSDKYFAEFLINGLTRGDIKTRYGAYAVGRQWGWLSVNDIREMENLNPVGPEGDIYLTPMNMVDSRHFEAVSKLAAEGDDAGGGGTQSSPGSTDEDNPEPSKTLLNSIVRNSLPTPFTKIDFTPSLESFEQLTSEALGKAFRKEEKLIAKRKSSSEIETFNAENKVDLVDSLRPIIRSFFQVARLMGINEQRAVIDPVTVNDVIETVLKEAVEDIYASRSASWKDDVEKFCKSEARNLISFIHKYVYAGEDNGNK